MRLSSAWRVVWALGMLPWAVTLARAQSAPTAPEAGASASVVGRTRATLHTLLDQLVGSDRTMRRAAARSIDSLGAAGVPAMGEELVRQRPGRPAAEITALLAKVRATPDAGDAAELDALLDLPPEASGPAYIETVTTLCLVQALVHAGTPEAVATFAPVALDAHGAFAPEVTRALSALGERASAGLVLMSHARGLPAQRWAIAELEALGKRTPNDAVQTKSKEVLADVLLAYGTVRDADALPVLMSFINADRRLVRDAARDGLAAYGDDAAPKLRETYGLLLGEAPPLDWPTPWLRKKLFEALDRVRLEDVDARVHEGLALAQEGRFAEAVADFDDVLARQPDWDKKGELVPAYVFAAQSLLGTDPVGARSLLEKALALDPDGPRVPQIESALFVLDGEALAARGLTDAEPFRRALALDPGNAAAGAALARIEDLAEARRRAWKRWWLLGAASLIVVSALILFAGGRRGRPTKPPATRRAVR